MASQSKLSVPHWDVKAKQIVLELTQLYLSNRTRISRAVWITLFVALVNRVRHAISEQKAASVREAAQREARKGTVSSSEDGAGGEKPKKKVALDREFFRSLMRLVKIVIPGWKSKEARLLISHSVFLILRTLISVKVAEMDGAIVKALVKGQGKEFLMRIMWWMIIAIPATFTNSMVSTLFPEHPSLLLTSVALLSPSGVVAQIQNQINAIHSRSVPLETHVLRPVSPRRPYKEPRSVDCRRRVQVLQQLGRTLQQPGQAYSRHGNYYPNTRKHGFSHANSL